MKSPLERRNASHIIQRLVSVPPWWVEYGYYFSTAYTTLGVYFGLEIPMLASALTVALAFLCLQHFGSQAKKVLAPVAFLLASLIVSMGVQIVLYQTPIRDPYITLSILWVSGMIIVQSLAMRSGFFYRCAIVVFVIGIIPLRDLTLGGAGDGTVHQARVDAAVQGNLSHPAGLAYWFGFCAVFFAIAGLEEKRVRTQILYWVAAVGCLVIVSLTVQRGPLMAVAIALTIALRHILKRGFIPLLVLLILTGIILESGLFADSAAQYQTRGLQETGRLIVWQIIIERILDSPWVGVGATDVGTQLFGDSRVIMPHNAFLYFALASGVVPFALFVAFWIRATLTSLTQRDGSESAVFRIPFLVYGFIFFMVGDGSPEPWVLLILSAIAGHGIPHRMSRITVLRRIRRPGAAPSLARPSTIEGPR